MIFRVIPLCTREGSTFHGGVEDFPDEGSLRIVPDKREQSTFKERMREIGGLCTVQLISDGKELMKVRQNRNYAPDQGERNQNAIYSDVICEFTDGGCYEVLELGESTQNVLTEKVLLHKDKVLYGPVACEDATTVEGLKPFGNDRFLLHTIDMLPIGRHRIYWDPEATLNWRQRRNSLRRRDRAADTEEAEAILEEEHEEDLALPRAMEDMHNKEAAVAAPASPSADISTPLEGAPVSAASAMTQVAQTPSAVPLTSMPAGSAAAPVSPAAAGSAASTAGAKKAMPAPANKKTKEAPSESAQQMSAAASTTEKTPEKTPVAEAPERAARRSDARSRRVERSAQILQQEEQQPQEKQKPALPQSDLETALPIGAKLEILDVEMPFDQQISRLAQPLSDSANRLMAEPTEPVEEPQETVAHFSGTPLAQTAGHITRVATRPEPLHHVVEQQLRHQRDEVMGAQLGEGTYRMVENPIDSLRDCVGYIWQSVEMREQALPMLMENESFVSDLLRAFRQNGLNTHATAAAQEQLSEIEAERLSLLMQLEDAKENERKFREQAINSLTSKKRDEAERLKREVKELQKTKQELERAMRVLSKGTADEVTAFLSQQMSCLSGAGEQRILLAPVLGKSYTQQELAERLRVHMNDCGFSLSDDDAMSLLINFSLCDVVCFRATSIANAQLFSAVLLESFGLESVSALVSPGSYVEMVSLLAEDTRRTPTITVQPLGTETMSVFGHKTIYLTDESAMPVEVDALVPYPVINVPQILKRAFGHTAEWESVEPSALSSFTAIRADAHPLLEEAEKWFVQLKSALSETELRLSDALLLSMHSFIEIASRKVRGGFLSAADTAVCHWIVPMLMLRKVDSRQLATVFAHLPHALDMLGIR
ncbi:MAG: hypothetical protein RR367_08850 [Clostridia bacterium]